ncbi:hypothetical protein OBBRIDRAFT_599951 [Obba rivulosa]|uniref:Uncharacterized protein n=1 Tax=Obba rivulosa TaxID=1052685 RepID=A0A8E2DM17_9APHY|nr:hypothetical protein OBBRIDRAFT_599951 [Obba rivulosa]
MHCHSRLGTRILINWTPQSLQQLEQVDRSIVPGMKSRTMPLGVVPDSEDNLDGCKRCCNLSIIHSDGGFCRLQITSNTCTRCSLRNMAWRDREGKKKICPVQATMRTCILRSPILALVCAITWDAIMTYSPCLVPSGRIWLRCDMAMTGVTFLHAPLCCGDSLEFERGNIIFASFWTLYGGACSVQFLRCPRHSANLHGGRTLELFRQHRS